MNLIKKIRGIGFFLFLHFTLLPVAGQSGNHEQMLNSYDVKFYFLDLEISNLSIAFQGSVSILAEITNSDSDSLSVQLNQELTLDSLEIDGEQVPFIHTDDYIRFKPIYEYQSGDIIQMVFYYRFSVHPF